MRKISTRDQSEEISVPAHSFVNSKYTLIICLTVIVFMISGLYLLFEWNRYQKMASSEAIQLVNSPEALMPGKHISELSGMAD
ncbi:MAG: hypothetical protein GX808_09665, partial [Syntrophomonadaceae bacterium]|nr:hypothetical protein [Syntrophomonadaceae bacterium]